MECLASFVLLVVLPLSMAALVVSLRALAAARRTGREAELLATTVQVLGTRLHAAERAARAAGVAEPGSAEAAAAPEPGVAARPTAAREEAAAPGVPLEAARPMPAPGPPPVPGGPVRPPLATPAAAADASHAARVPPPPFAAAGAVSAPAEPARRGPSLEERLGARLPVWIGAIVMVLAAAYLVKYSVDQGWIGPTVRVAIGALFGVGLLTGGELLRRSSAQVAQGLTAAGIAVLFVVELAALHLYHLIGPPTGFALLALTTATAVALALRQGPIVALIGLVGGFLAPALVHTGEPNARLLFGYLTLLMAGLLAVSRRRGWGPLAGLTMVAALVWAGGWAASSYAAADAAVIGVFLVVAVGATLVASAGSGERWGAPLGSWARGAATAGALLVAAGLAGHNGYGLLEWGFVGLLAAACLVLARLSPELEALAWLAAGAVCFLLLAWAERLQPADAPHFFGVAGGALLLLGGGAWALQRGAPSPARWATLAAAASLAVDLLAWRGSGVADLHLPWGWVELGLAAIWVVLALPAARQRADLESDPHPQAGPGSSATPDWPSAQGVLAAAAAAATTFVSLAVPMELERQWIAAGWALEVTALVWLAGRLRVPLLGLLAAVLTALVGARLLLNPAVVTYPMGDDPFLTWLLYGYGVPIAALAVAALIARRGPDVPRSRRLLGAFTGAVAVALGVVFLGLAVHQAFHPGLRSWDWTVAELGTLTTMWLLLAGGLLAAAKSHPRPELRWGGPLVACLAIGQALLTQGLVSNPMLAHVPVGGRPVLNAVTLAYGLPALLLVVLAALERRVELAWGPEWPVVPRLWSVAALLLLFLLVTLEVRQAFRGDYLDSGTPSQAEGYAYSAAWVLLAVGLLVAGLVRKRRSLRLASLPVMLLAVGKVFLYDTAHLSDLYRVFSFFGLGVSLLLIAWLYQRFVFRTTPEAP